MVVTVYSLYEFESPVYVLLTLATSLYRMNDLQSCYLGVVAHLYLVPLQGSDVHVLTDNIIYDSAVI